MEFTVENYFSSQLEVIDRLDKQSIKVGINMIRMAVEKNRKIITCGNGGSAQTASHFITDWNKMFNLATGKKFRGICLSDNPGLVTAYGNDISFEEIFSGQINSIMDPGDLLIALSGSGNSANVLNAVKAAKAAGGSTIALVGYDGGKLKPLCDHSIWIPSFDMQLCEDIHFMFGHMVMKELCGSSIRQ